MGEHWREQRSVLWQFDRGFTLPDIIPIDHPDDPHIALYRNVRERDLVGRDGLFIAEGEVVLRALLGQRRHAVVSLLVAQKRLPALAPLLRSLPEDVPVFAATQSALDAVVGFPLHRGILAIGRRAPDLSPDALLRTGGDKKLVLGLFGIANHDNMGGIFRNAAAFGAGIVLDATCCDPLYRKALRVGVGAPLLVPFARLSAEEDIFDLADRAGFAAIALSPNGATSLAALQRPERTLLLLGTEGHGLPDSILARTRTVRIPMAAGFDSLNVATTSGIALYHLSGAG